MTPEPSDIGFILIVASVAFLAGLGKGGLGPALGGVIVPIMSIIMDARQAVIISLPLYIVGDWLSVRAYWKEWDTRILLLTFPTASVGVLIGTYLLANLPGDTLRLILGIMSLLIGLYKLAEIRMRHIRYTPRNWHGFVSGLVTGIGAALASAGGPAYSAYLLLQQPAPRAFIGTTAIFFAMINLLRLPALAQEGLFDWERLRALIPFTPLVWLGVIAGSHFARHVNPVVFERLMTAILIGAGLILIAG